jgi:hypothetical protein
MVIAINIMVFVLLFGFHYLLALQTQLFHALQALDYLPSDTKNKLQSIVDTEHRRYECFKEEQIKRARVIGYLCIGLVCSSVVTIALSVFQHHFPLKVLSTLASMLALVILVLIGVVSLVLFKFVIAGNRYQPTHRVQRLAWLRLANRVGQTQFEEALQHCCTSSENHVATPESASRRDQTEKFLERVCSMLRQSRKRAARSGYSAFLCRLLAQAEDLVTRQKNHMKGNRRNRP